MHPSSLGIFRILVGIVFLVQFGRLEEYITYELPKSTFFLTYPGFHWIHPLSTPGFETLFLWMHVSAVLVMLGFLYRPAIIFLFFSWTYVFLLCNGHYNNHYYMLSLVALLMIFTEADRWGSVKSVVGSPFLGKRDGKWGLSWSKGPGKDVPLPFWQPFSLQFLIALVYFYGGLAKLNKDWLEGYPMKLWLPGKTDFPLFPEFLQTEFAPYFFSYLGLVTDLALPFFLFSRRLRVYSLFFLIPFHILNHFLWQIGVFPWFMLFGTIIFFTFSPEQWKSGFIKGSLPKTPAKAVQLPFNKLAFGLLLLFMGWQILFPFRQYLYGGKSFWTGMGWNFSWHMMLVDKSYATRIKLEVPEENISGYVEMLKYINGRQFKYMGHDPRHYIRFAHMLRDEMKANGLQHEPRIYVHSFREVNARPFQLVLDTTVNLANYEYSPFRVPDVILPFKDLPHEQGYLQLTPEEREMLGIRGTGY
ncbi:MAG: HTTM domain-containing protein [Bacteroidia bacterium]|nr:HTTM domain-containing protein [Bacteroidia bacterium]